MCEKCKHARADYETGEVYCIKGGKAKAHKIFCSKYENGKNNLMDVGGCILKR